MAKLTQQQVDKWNAQAKNGFIFDIEYFVIWNEKTLVKNIKQEDGSILQFKLWYMPEYEEKTNEHGCRWNVKTGRHTPTMRIDRLVPSSTKGVYVVHNEKDIVMGEPENTMKFSTLCKISGMVDTSEYIKQI